MSLFAFILTELTAELALFAAAGFLLFALDDLARRPHLFRAPRLARGGDLLALPAELRRPPAVADAAGLDRGADSRLGRSAVIAPMLRATLERFDA